MYIVHPMSSSVQLSILVVSTHLYQTSGYSKVSYGLLKELAKYPFLKVTHFGIQGLEGLKGARCYPEGITVYPIDTAVEQGFGFSQLATAIETVKPHIVFLYNDIGIVKAYMDKIVPGSCKVWVYIDQIYETIPPSCVTVLNNSDRIFCYTQGWKALFKKAGVTKPIDLLPIGYDPTLFQIMSKSQIREIMKIPKDIFLFMNVNRNQPRKHYDLLVMAFVELILKHPEQPLFMMCVCDNGETGGHVLSDIFRNELVRRGVAVELFANRLVQSSKHMTFTDEEHSLFYQVADVGVTCTDGEGVGLCALESMGLGVPQVLPAILGHQEFCTHENSRLVEPTIRQYNSLTVSTAGCEVKLVDPSVFAVAMEDYVLKPEMREAHGLAAAAKAEQYTWPTVTAAFVKRLELLYQELVLDSQ